MHTIFWLAVFVAVCGIGRFVLAALWYVLALKFGDWTEQLVVEHHGFNKLVPWMWLFGGIAGLIVAVTI